MSGADQTILAQAADWHIASTRDDMDWDGFTRWLEADPRHSAAYDEVALADAALSTHGAPLASKSPAANDDEAAGSHRPFVAGWKRWTSFAVAASLAALLAMPWLGSAGPAIYTTTAATQSITLDDGSQIILAPHSRLEVDGAQQQKLALEGGAWFDIRHNPGRPMSITAGDLQVSDIGTSFDIQESAGQVRVAVSEGKLTVSSQAFAKPIDLPVGRSLTFDPAGGKVTVRPVRTEDAGAWRNGRLTYESASLGLVAADLARYAGITVTVDKSLRDRRFSGTLIVGNGDEAVRDLAQLMGVGLTGSDGVYRLVAR